MFARRRGERFLQLGVNGDCDLHSRLLLLDRKHAISNEGAILCRRSVRTAGSENIDDVDDATVGAWHTGQDRMFL